MKKHKEPKKRTKVIALFLALLMLIETIVPNMAFALSGGPSQPEIEGFTPVGANDMVDLFTGDFNYSIPLMDVDGYPINLGYQSGVGMDQEASWVGLGWNLNPGSINRSKRGLPDDFKGDEIQKRSYVKPSSTFTVGGGFDLKVFGLKTGYNPTFGVNLELFYNTYKGMGVNLYSDLNLMGYTKKGDEDASTPNVKDVLKRANTLVSKDGTLSSNPSPTSGIAITTELGTRQANNTGKHLRTTQSISNKVMDGLSSYFSSSSPYVPQFASNVYNSGYRAEVVLGSDVVGFFAGGKINCSYTSQRTDGSVVSKKAYGSYYYNKDGSSGDDLLDFNREKEGFFSNNRPVLPIPYGTSDVFSVSGHGVGGMFKVANNGINLFHNTISKGSSDYYGANFEFGPGPDFHFGGSLMANMSSSFNGRWQNSFTSSIIGIVGVDDKPEFERTYFKMLGEKNSINESLIFNKKPNVPYKPIIKATTGFFGANVTGEVGPDNAPAESLVQTYGGTSNLYDDKRVVRNTYISALTYDEKEAFRNTILLTGELIKGVNYLDATNNPNAELAIPYNFGVRAASLYYPTDPSRKGHHIGEITINQTNGSKYVYGIAAYNNFEKEYLITVGGAANDALPFVPNQTTLNHATNIVDINNQIAVYKSEGMGSEFFKSDRFYQEITTPGYAHSYLLTDVLQADYVDLAPRGTGPEDLGNYTKFNYVRTTKNYKWRAPAIVGKANFIEGLKSEVYDNKASFVEGEKELWYLQTIESKNHIAVFVIEPRNDGMPVSHEAAGQFNGFEKNSFDNNSFRLKKIVLFTRAEYEKAGNPLIDATPIKTVWFDYSYKLCKGIYNSWKLNEGTSSDLSGKLTLTGIYYTYGKSTKKINGYKFDYAFNPNYNQANVDRWGNFKSDPLSGELRNIDYPYVKQDKANADINASAWNLNMMKLPSGAIVNIHYEADDYAYVQNKRAAQMMKIEAVGSSSTFPTGQNMLYSDEGHANNNYLFFSIPTEFRNVNLRDKYIAECLDQVKQISYKVTLGIRDASNYEWVTGYANVESFGPASENDAYFYVKIKTEKMESLVEDRYIHAFTKTGFNFAKANLPFSVNPVSLDEISDANISAKERALKLLGLANLKNLLTGVEDDLISRGPFCRYIDLSKSFCRLNSPFRKKLGGGARVKKITIDDSWASITDAAVAGQEYGQMYDYTTTENVQGVDMAISSGVASYEPAVGSEENPFKEALSYSVTGFLKPDSKDMVEGPIGESFFPSPSVGYSKVTVSNIGRSATIGIDLKKVKTHGVGKTITSFYTTKDFPMVVNYTGITNERKWIPLIDLIVFRTQYEERYVSQGISIECNDMNGKTRSVEVFKEQEVTDKMPILISGTYYNYRTQSNNPNKLDNSNVQLIDDNGIVSKGTIGVEAEMYADSQKNLEDAFGAQLHKQVEVLALFWYIPFPPWYPVIENSRTEFYSLVLNKASITYGILDSVMVIQDGSKVSTKNIAFDKLTGEVLVTQTKDEFEKDVYKTDYPAYWLYDYMGHGYKNAGIAINNASLDVNNCLTGTFPYGNYLYNDDELLIAGGAAKRNVKVVLNAGKYKLYDAQTGALVTQSNWLGQSSFTIKIIASGRKNLQQAEMLTANSLEKPFTSASGLTKLDLNETKKMLGVSANTFQIDQSTYKSFKEKIVVTDSVYFVNQHFSALNHLLKASNVSLTSSFFSGTPSSISHIYNVSEGILGTTNPYTRSFIYNTIEQELGSSNHILSMKMEAANSNVGYENLTFEFTLFNNTFSKHLHMNIVLPSTYNYNNTTFHTTHKLDRIELAGEISGNLVAYENNCQRLYDAPAKLYFKNISTGDDVPVNVNINVWTNFLCAQVVVDKEIGSSSNQHNTSLADENKRVVVKPHIGLVYKGERLTNTDRFANNKGTFKTYTNFFRLDTKVMDDLSNLASNWKTMETATLFDPYNGSGIESKDALNKYKSMVYFKDQFVSNNMFMSINNGHYGISNKPQIMVDNAQQREVTAFNFESENEVRLITSDKQIFNNNDKHYFEKVSGSLYISNINSLVEGSTKGIAHTGKDALVLNGVSSRIAANFYIANNDATNLNNAILPFYPLLNKKYVISGWVRGSNTFYSADDIKASCKVEILNFKRSNILNPVTIFTPTGPIINGWQRFSGEFTIQNGFVEGEATDAYILRVVLQNNESDGKSIYFDDIRLHPYDANMKNYIYDEQHRVVSILDENNYAVFYTYNERGELVTIKRETEKGIVTVEENKKNNAKLD